MRSSRHHAAAAAFATAQAFDEPGNRSAGVEPEPHKVMLRDDAAVLTAQAAHHDNRARTLHYIAHCQLNVVTDS
jgi:uncharacterized ferritin-like protein (DUF455 family)